jgi:bifunctional oligoribonuclease and PAP phosphatase NrnA
MIMNNILSKIKNSNKICITCHTSPDGDAAGSVLALAIGLKHLGKEVCVLSTDPISSSYEFLPYSELMNGNFNYVPEDADCVIVLDCGNFQRINADLKLEHKNYLLINIDHHISNDMYGDLNFVDTNAAAVGEIVYQMLEILGVKIDKDIAECLYTSLLTDTGSFRFSNTTSVTHTIAGDLINCGVNVDDMYRMIYENKSYDRIKLYGALISSMKLVHNNKICVMKLTKNIVNNLNLSGNMDTSDVLPFGMQIDTVEVVVLIKEIDDGVKASLRSKNKVDVRKIAEVFGGGGHVKASGLCLNKSIDEAEGIIVRTIENELIQ